MAAGDALGQQWPRRIPVESMGFKSPPPATERPDALVEGGERIPHELDAVTQAIPLVKPTTIHPHEMELHATQPYLTRGSLMKHADAPRRGRYEGPDDTPIIGRTSGGDYVINGHHRIAGAMMRREPISARIVDAQSPEHQKLAQQMTDASEHVRAMYHATGLNREQFGRLYPEHQPNAKRRELGLPPRRRR